MEKSETIGELAKALCIVQGKLTGAKKDSINPFFKAKYADLASVWDACRSLLSENGLSVVQTNTPSGENTATIDTTLLHNSGEWISGSLEVPLAKNDPQGLGSAMTYARRYALAAIVGVCPEDDDAESATKRDTKPEVTTATTKPSKNKGSSPVSKPSDILLDYCKTLGWDANEWHEYLKKNFNADKYSDLKEKQVLIATNNLKAMVMVKGASGETPVIDKSNPE